MFLKQRLHNLALVSLLSFLIFLIVVLAVIDPVATISIFTVSAVICDIIRYTQPHRVDQFLLRWDDMHSLVHWGIISVFILSMFYYLFYFLRNFKIDFNIVPIENND